MKTLAYLLIFFLVLIVNHEMTPQSVVLHQEQDRFKEPVSESKWTLSTSFQVTGGSYVYNEYSTLYLFYAGIRYQINNLTLYGYIPFVAQNNPGFMQSGMMIIPAGSENEGQGSSSSGWNMHGDNNSMNQSSMMNSHISLGDFYLYGSYRLLNENSSAIELYISPGIKIPTASANIGIGTGQFDYSLSLNFRRSIESFIILAEAGFIMLGDPTGIDYENPFTYGIGLGKFISQNGNSVLLYYYAYTKILNNYEPPRQVSLGLNFNLSSTTSLSLIGSKGLSNYSPDFSVSGGINFNL